MPRNCGTSHLADPDDTKRAATTDIPNDVPNDMPPSPPPSSTALSNPHCSCSVGAKLAPKSVRTEFPAFATSTYSVLTELKDGGRVASK
eukprot:3041073-Pleurochrysis_carterae.AAC.1